MGKNKQVNLFDIDSVNIAADYGFKDDSINLDFFDKETNIDITAEFENKKYIKPSRLKPFDETLILPNNAIELAKVLTLKKGDRYFAIVNGSFVFGDLIVEFIRNNNFHVKEMIISTLSFSYDNIERLRALMNDGFLDKLTIVVSAYFFSNNRMTMIKYCYDMFEDIDSFQLAVAGTHVKTTIFETHCDKQFIFHGSANFRSSANLENICIEENTELYKFNYEYQYKIIDKFKTINIPLLKIQSKDLKPLRVKQLWELIK